jgi:hypothetical protein
VGKNVLIGLAIGFVLIGLSLLVYILSKKFNDKVIVISFWVVACVLILAMVAFPSTITTLKILGVL